MANLNDLKHQALYDAGFTEGSLSDREYQWLAYQTGTFSGASLADQWRLLAIDLGIGSGFLLMEDGDNLLLENGADLLLEADSVWRMHINHVQMALWRELGIGDANLLLENGDDLLLEDGGLLMLQSGAEQWNDMAMEFWAGGGLLTPTMLLLETGDRMLLETGDFLLLD